MELVDDKTFLRTILSALPSLVSYTDTSFVYRYVNPAYEKWFGVSSSDCVGKTIVQVVGEAGFQQARPYLDLAVLGEEQKFEQEIPYKTGGKRFVQVHFIPDFFGTRVRGVFIIVHDMTSQHLATVAVEKKKAELRKVLNGVPAMIGHWSRDLTNLNANAAYTYYFGKSPEELEGMHIKDFLGPAAFEKSQPMLQGVLAGNTQHFETEVSLPNGETSHLSATYRPDITNGICEGFFVIATDISERKKDERALLQAKDSAERALRVKSQFLDIAAHELRTPVTSLSLLLQVAQKKTEKGQLLASEMLVRLRGQADRLKKLVVDLLDVSRLEQGILVLRRVPTDLVSLISDCVEEFELLSPNRNVTFVRTEQPLFVDVDAVRISQVLSNYLDNAVKYTPEGCPIGIIVVQTSDGVRVTVQDRGAGISEELQKHLFSPFTRGSSDETIRASGLGLGLAVCRGIIDLHGGRVGVVSNNHGSSFFFEIPRNTASAT